MGSEESTKEEKVIRDGNEVMYGNLNLGQIKE